MNKKNISLWLNNILAIASILTQGNWEAFIAANFIILALAEDETQPLNPADRKSLAAD